jgi:hypothetical protein
MAHRLSRGRPLRHLARPASSRSYVLRLTLGKTRTGAPPHWGQRTRAPGALTTATRGSTSRHSAACRRARRPPTPAPVAAQVRLRMIVARHDARSLRAPRTARKATLWLRARRRRTGMGQRPYLGLRTALTLPLLPPPQKNVSLPFDSSPDTLKPGGRSISSSTSPDSGSTLRNSL